MEQARTTFTSEVTTTISGWAKSTRWLALAGALTTIFGVVAGASNAIPSIMKWLDVPPCLTYATAYCAPHGCFKNEGDVWREYQPIGGAKLFEFSEFERTRDEIFLVNLTPRAEEPRWKELVVSLPVCGGTARLSIGTPVHWINLAQVRRD